MPVLVIQVFGILVFAVGSLWLARMIRRSADRTVAERASRISHGLFWIALVLPGAAGFISPGLAAYDGLLGVPSLPWPAAGIALGTVLLAGGVVLIVVPVHVLNLKCFEERELALRLGDAYADYRRRVPFLIPRLGRAGKAPA